MNKNVVDEYKQLSVIEIKEKLQNKALPYAVMMMQIMGDFNFGTLIRNANAFGAKEVFYFGHRKRYDRRGCVGAHNYIPVEFKNIGNLDSIFQLREKYPHWIAMDILPGISSSMRGHNWKPNSLLIFGEESCGLPPEILHACDKVLHIPQRGSVRSINVGTASGIAMNDVMSHYETNNIS